MKSYIFILGSQKRKSHYLKMNSVNILSYVHMIFHYSTIEMGSCQLLFYFILKDLIERIPGK